MQAQPPGSSAHKAITATLAPLSNHLKSSDSQIANANKDARRPCFCNEIKQQINFRKAPTRQ